MQYENYVSVVDHPVKFILHQRRQIYIFWYKPALLWCTPSYYNMSITSDNHNFVPFSSNSFWSSSYSTKTNELPILLQKLLKLPLKNPVNPSVLRILDPQSAVPLYCLSEASFPLSIINLLLIVSRGYANVSEEEVTIWANKNLAKKEDFFCYSVLPQMNLFPAS